MRDESVGGVSPEIVPFTPSSRVASYIQYLHLPLNDRAFEFLVSDPDKRGTEYMDAWRSVLLGDGSSECIVKSEGVVADMLDCLTLLTIWDPSILSPEYEFRNLLPNLIHPFVALFWATHPHFCTELIMSFVRNFYCHVSRPCMVMAYLSDWDTELALYLESLPEFDPSILAATCSSLLTDVWDGECWLRFLDLIVMHFRNSCRNHVAPHILDRVLAQYIIHEREFIMSRVNSVGALESWLTNIHNETTPDDVGMVFEQAITHSASSDSIKPYIISERWDSYPPCWTNSFDS
jgi:hypothetical protein